MAVILAVDHYVTGTARTYVLQQQVSRESGITDEDFWAAQEPILDRAMASGHYPEVARLPEDAFTSAARRPWHSASARCSTAWRPSSPDGGGDTDVLSRRQLSRALLPCPARDRPLHRLHAVALPASTATV